VTHEYVIATGGRILGAATEAGSAPTAIAWAADRVLAVGSDPDVRAISRGDSIFIDLDGSAVSSLPSDLALAEQVVRAAVSRLDTADAAELLERAGLLPHGRLLEPGSRADLAVWSADPGTVAAGDAPSLRILAVVLGGAFTSGDEHCGPFARVVPPG
jgi:predicted amidohydrolase YtcJ